MNISPFLDKPTAIVGTTGAGKTFTAKGAVEQLLELGRRVIVIDPTGAWYGLRSGADGNAEEGFPVLIFGGDHADIEISPDAGEQLAEAIAGRDVQAIIDTSEMTGGEKTRFLTDFFQKLYAMNRAALHLVVDEADEICPQNPMPDERRLSGAFDKIVRRGRIKGFRPLMITQRPAVLHKNVLSQIGTLVALKLTSPQDRKAIEDWVKGNADAGQAREVMQSLPTLKRGEGWIWSPADSVLQRVEFPPIRTFDSSRTPDAGETVVAPAMTAVDVAALRKAMQAEPQERIESASSVNSRHSTAEIEAARQGGYDSGFEDGKKIGWNAANLKFREALANRRTGIANALNEALQPIFELELPYASIFEDAGSPSGKATAFDAVTAGSNPAPAVTAFGIDPANKRSERKTVARVENGKVVGSFDLGAERKPLAVLAAAYPAGYTDAQWASLAGFKRTGDTWSTYKSRLRKQALIEERGDLFFATVAGVSAIGADMPEMPKHPADRLAMWKSKLSGVGPMLDALRAVYPQELTREQLADRVELAVGGGTFGTYLSRLRANGLIDEPEKGLVRLSSIIMGVK